MNQPQYPQGYGPPQYQQQAGQQQAQQLAQGSIDDFFNQPTTGWGPAWSFGNGVPINTSYIGIVARKVTGADIEQQTAPNGGPPLFFKDGRPKFVMKVPMVVQPDQKYTDGKAQFYVGGKIRDELARAMSAVGAPEGPPEEGAAIQVTKIGEQRNNFNTMSPVLQVSYQRPEGAAPVNNDPAPQAEAAPPAAPQVPAPVAPAAPPAVPEGMTPEQAARLAQLTGQATS